MTIKAIFFDVGETLVDETRQWSSWADWLGVSRLAFSAALEKTIAEGRHHRRVFDIFKPGFDLNQAEAARLAQGNRYAIEPRDFYPDAIPALRRLKASGYVVGIAGNQPEETEAALERSGIAADHIASSARWGVEKPSPDFFAKIVDVSGFAANEVAYVGDRLDNDILPAKQAGLLSVFIVRGPWGHIHARYPEADQADVTIHALDELPAALRRIV
jgi:HAD superfamily hydrolase (TIGR01549 family)